MKLRNDPNIQCDDPLFFAECAKDADMLRARAWPGYYVSNDKKIKEKVEKETNEPSSIMSNMQWNRQDNNRYGIDIASYRNVPWLQW